MNIILGAILVAGSGATLTIEPGVGIGHVRIGETPGRLEVVFGKPQQGEAASGRIWMSWLGRDGHRLDVYAVRTVDTVEAHTRFVRIDSPQFSMKNGLRVGAKLSTFQGKYPQLKLGPSGRVAKAAEVTVWDDAADGFSVEVRNRKVTAIAVHRTSDPIDGTYFAYLSDPTGSQ